MPAQIEDLEYKFKEWQAQTPTAFGWVPQITRAKAKVNE
jgi:hypothetical protein